MSWWSVDAMLIGGVAVWVALAVDHYWGEPPARWHPVVAMGWCLARGNGLAPSALPALPDQAWNVKNFMVFLIAALYWIAVAAIFFIAAWALQSLCLGDGTATVSMWQTVGTGMVLGVLLKPMLAWRMLHDEVAAVETALQTALPAGRERLSYLVSREVTSLSIAEVRESAIETLAENLNDSVVAPLFWFAVAGLPGAVLYRFANTADAMWGYHGVRHGRVWTWAGKWAARADDVLSWLPARLTTALLWAGLSWSRWRSVAVEAQKTPSPNGGWCMGAMALALQVRLGKPQVYVLNDQAPAPDHDTVMQALKYAKKLRLSLVFIAAAAIFLGILA